jgi:hypothetical protein
MTCIKPKKLPNPSYVRLPEDLVDAIREQALRNERTFSGEVRWLLQRVMEELYPRETASK